MGRVRRVRVWSLAFLAVFSWLAAPSAQSPQAATPDAAKAGGDGPLTLQGQNGRPGGGRGAGPRAGAGGRPSLTVVRAAQPPTIDGRLDDALWRTGALIDKFVQETPVEGAPATEKTEVRVAYDSDKLYFGVYAHYSSPSLIRANRADR